MSKDKMPKRWVGCDVEEEYFGDERKLSKQERKLASSRDRSKYKKTDKEKFQRSLDEEKKLKAKENLLRGRVLSIKPEGIIVECQGVLYTCILRGLLKKEKTQQKNLAIVGDFVLFEATGPQEGVISDVEPRRTVLSRADNLNRRKEQLIAANIDQVIITASILTPPLKFPLIDRYIIAAHKGGMDAIVVVNKVDLLNLDPEEYPDIEVERILLEEGMAAYEKAGITFIPASIKEQEGIDRLKEAMKNKTSVFSGQSGVGKSSLINAVTGLSLPIGEIVEKTKKGSHTTTTARLVQLEFGGWCIDTPGIKSFGLWDLQKDEIEQYFTEIYEKGHECRFPDCSHTHEKDCAVIAAVEAEEISPIRYESYVSLIESIGQTHLRR